MTVPDSLEKIFAFQALVVFFICQFLFFSLAVAAKSFS